VRIEDLDHARRRPGAAATILATLEAFELHWDGAVEYQSRRTEHYRTALERLETLGLTFPCSCSRRERSSEAAAQGRYPGTCRGGTRHGGPSATRLWIDEQLALAFEDAFQGRIVFPAGTLGDVIVRRRDGVFAYQLAVVVDDALQGVTAVVRGADLLESTGWQIALQHSLGLPRPRYAHLPLLTEPGGAKLAKSRHALALDPGRAGAQLFQVLELLRQGPPPPLAGAPAREVLAWALAHWNPAAFHGLRQVALRTPS
jgi:glutamyl-Q tRNA(Asp) synthetase